MDINSIFHKKPINKDIDNLLVLGIVKVEPNCTVMKKDAFLVLNFVENIHKIKKKNLQMK